MGKRRGMEADAPGQLLMTWGKAAEPREPALPSEPVEVGAVPSPTQTFADDIPRERPALVQRLRWDFRRSFPSPLPEAIDAGVLNESDAEPENLRELHRNFEAECLSALKALDAAHHARRRGVDPATGKKPTSQAGRERLRRRLHQEPARLQHAFTILIETYTSAFGDEAADAFTKALRARHAGIPVIDEADEDESRATIEVTNPLPVMTDTPKTEVPTTADNGPADVPPAFNPAARAARKSARVISRLPVPKPLPEAVAAGRFGHDEASRPIRPGPDEIREITLEHAGKLIDLLHSPAANPADRQRLEAEFRSAIAAYAEDFGDTAAARLEAYARRQAAILDRPAPQGRSR